MISRPSLDEVRAWRLAVDAAVSAALPSLPTAALALVALGVEHEQQHQELFLTDILASLAENPLDPAYGAIDPSPCFAVEPMVFLPGREGVVEVGTDGPSFDCERPRHKALLHPHAIANRCVTNGEWIEFVEAGGYEQPTLWLSEGWEWVQRCKISAPLYWRDYREAFTLGGRRVIDRSAPVSHISYYEAEAFARWAGARLPTEFEWEDAFASADPNIGNQLDRVGPVVPRPGGGPFSDVWQWTRSAYLPYPGFVPAEGTVGEYNGKFMCGQFVLKGASCATPRGHSRSSYRNFFPPAARWQFTGVRLARDS
jgi:ergothioneine biosynthesis protein EgtB